MSGLLLLNPVLELFGVSVHMGYGSDVAPFNGFKITALVSVISGLRFINPALFNFSIRFIQTCKNGFNKKDSILWA